MRRCASTKTHGRALREMAARVSVEQLNSRLSCVLSVTFTAQAEQPHASPYIVLVTDPIRTRLTNRIHTGLFQPDKCVTC